MQPERRSPWGEQRRAHAAPEGVLRYERLVSTVPCALYDYVRWPDGRSRFLYISPQCADIFEHPAAAIMQDHALLWSMVHPDDLERLKLEDGTANQTGGLFQSEVRIRLPSRRRKWIQLISRPGPHREDGQTVWSGVILDVSERKRIEEERDHLVEELRTALAEVKTLSGFLPICMRCKKIRDDHGYWNQLEAYISDHSGVRFSHGVCPDCAAQMHAEIDQSRRNVGSATIEA